MTTIHPGDDAAGDTVELKHPDLPMVSHGEKHAWGGEHIKSVIYGGLDGIVSVFVTVAATTKGKPLTVLGLGLAKLLAGAIAMGVGDWMSTRAEVDMAKRERSREEWECDNYLQGEIDEMVELYVAKGVPEDVARRIMEILSKNQRAFVDVMMCEELGITRDNEEAVPWKAGLINFGSFMAFGIVPLVAFVIIVALFPNAKHSVPFLLSALMSTITLFGMGAVKGTFTSQSWLKSGITTLLFGTFVALVGWGTVLLLNFLFPGSAI